MTGRRLASAIWNWRTHRKDMEARLNAARDEVQRSQQALDEAREQVIRPLQRAERDNHLAELIRDSLIEGYGR